MVDILFLAHKRPEFTRASLRALLANTNHQENFYVCTDNGCDGMGFPELRGLPNCTVDRFHYGGPVACTNGFLNSLKQMRAADKLPPEATPEFIAKIDNDVIVPPGWLPACLDIMRRFPNIDLLGIEPWTPDTKLFRWNTPVMPEPANYWKFLPRPVSHIGGIGVFRRSAFERFGRPVPNAADGRYGFTEWQWQKRLMVKAFIDPPLPVFLLDHLPFGPWDDLSLKYETTCVCGANRSAHQDSIGRPTEHTYCGRQFTPIQRDVGWKYDTEKHRALWDWWLASGEGLGAERLDVGGIK